MSGRRYEQGGVVSFVVVAVVLAAALAAGIWFAKQQRVSTPSNPDVSQVVQDVAEGDNQNQSESATGSNDSNQANDTSNTQNDTQEAPVTSGANNNTGSTNQTGNVSGTGIAQSGPSENTLPSAGPSTIPSTGPAEWLVALVSVSGLGFGLYVFDQSQKRLRASALK